MKYTMRINIIFFILIFAGKNYSYSQDSTFYCNYEIDTVTLTKIYSLVDTEATYPGGIEEMMRFIGKNVEYPSCGDFTGRVYISFIVNADGSISNILVKKGVSKEVDQAAINVILKMPNWIPAKCQNENVTSRMMLPIFFN